MEKITAKIKELPEDFIVEEIGDNWQCSISNKEVFNQTPDLSKLDKTSPKDFLWCELEKKDIDHFKAIKDLANAIKKDVRDIGYAGSKDKKAWTSQRISIFKPDLTLIENFKHPSIYLKNFKWEKRKIKLGYLESNKFKITLRNLDKKESIKISSKIAKVKSFPNYFGEQRFGSIRENNVKVGEMLLKKKFKEAVITLLTEISPNEKEEVTAARKRLSQEMNFNEAIKFFPPFLRLEKQLLFYLAKNPEDFLGAIKRADRKTVLMFVNSVQSKVFNEILEKATEENIDFTREGQKSCLLVGYKSKFSAGRLGEIEQEVLEINNLSLEGFNLKEIPYLRIKGSYRKALTEVKNLSAETSEDEAFNCSRKITLSFTLPSGVYATTFLESFFEF